MYFFETGEAQAKKQKNLRNILELTEISAVKFSGTTLHSGLGIKPGAKLSLQVQAKSFLSNKISEAKKAHN